MKQLVSLLLTIISGTSTVTAAAQAPAVQYPKLSKTLDSLAYVDQWPMQQIIKQEPDSAGRKPEENK